MLGRFELFIANRYLRAKRRTSVISLITVITILGVAAGVMALVVALAINNGFRNTFQRTILSVRAHVSILEKEVGAGVENWKDLSERLVRIPNVESVSPGLYAAVFLSGPIQSDGAQIKGIDVTNKAALTEALRTLKEGSIYQLQSNEGLKGIVLGSLLSHKLGMPLNSVVTVISPQGELTPFGPRPSYTRFRVVGIFETGFYDLDDKFAYMSLQNAQQILSLPDVVNTIEINLKDPERAAEAAKAAQSIIGPKLATLTWMEENRNLRNALRMERLVTAITIGLIMLVAGLNILITLTMLVMEKHKDIAILMSMGATKDQIRRIFLAEGLFIGALGTVIGLIAGYAICFIAGKYKLLRLDEEVYALSYVPFEPVWLDAFWIAGAAILVSALATLYPARNAASVVPVETLRYE